MVASSNVSPLFRVSITPGDDTYRAASKRVEVRRRAAVEMIDERADESRHLASHVALRRIQRPDLDGAAFHFAPVDQGTGRDVVAYQRRRHHGRTRTLAHRVVD